MSAGARHTTGGELVCLRETASCDETDFKSTEKESSSFDVAAQCVAEGFLLWKGDLPIQANRMHSNFFFCSHTVTSLFIHYFPSTFHWGCLRLWNHVECSHVFLLTEGCTRHSIWGIFRRFFFFFSSQGMFTSAWLSRHPTSWCQAPDRKCAGRMLRHDLERGAFKCKIWNLLSVRF